MATDPTNKLEQLRQAVLGNRRGREVEVEPTGEIRIPEESENSGQGQGQPQPSKVTKMSPHTFAM